MTRQESCDWQASHHTCSWLQRARYTYVTVVRSTVSCIVSECDLENNQSTHILVCMNHAPTLSCYPSIFWESWSHRDGESLRVFRLWCLKPSPRPQTLWGDQCFDAVLAKGLDQFALLGCRASKGSWFIRVATGCCVLEII